MLVSVKALAKYVIIFYPLGWAQGKFGIRIKGADP